MMQPDGAVRGPRALAVYAVLVLMFGLVPLAEALPGDVAELRRFRFETAFVPEQARRAGGGTDGPDVLRRILTTTEPRDVVVMCAWPYDPAWVSVFRRLRRFVAPRRLLALEDPRTKDAVTRAGVPAVYGVFLSTFDEDGVMTRVRPLLDVVGPVETLAVGPGWRFMKLPLR